MTKVFRFDDDMTYEARAREILDAYGLSDIEIHPDFIDYFVEYFGGMCGWEDDDYHYRFEIDWEPEKVKWFAELLTGKKMEISRIGETWNIIRDFNHDAERYDWMYRVITYLNDCRLVLFNNYEIETINNNWR